MAAPHAADPKAVEAFVLEAIAEGKGTLATRLRQRFGVSRPTAHNYLRSLSDRGVIVRLGRGHYGLATVDHTIEESVGGLAEHDVWEEKIQPLLAGLPPNALSMWHYGCTEMINNVIDHSESPAVRVRIKRTPIATAIEVHDFGVGIFRKIAKALRLDDDRHAVLELSKGKVTTDPMNHTGEGIYFSSRAFDEFSISSGGVFFDHKNADGEDWILGEEKPSETVNGTSVYMILSNTTKKQMKDVFDKYATDPEDYRFDKTVVPVKLLQYGDDRLISRSQAKRLLTRFDRFKTVLLDFDNVDSIGQAFADEIFRVFRSHHPEVEIIAIKANEQVTRMINRAISGRQPQADLFASAASEKAAQEEPSGDE
jgi:anti-sigma regulatory factor (Ser/Thr protein kinase)